MNNDPGLKLLFIINPASGARNTDWPALIKKQCTGDQCSFEIFELPEHCEPAQLSAKIKQYNPTRVIVAGGDGTVSLLAKCLLHTDIPLGILPGGSANGMAKELGIPMEPDKAIEVCLNGIPKKIHLLEVNDHLCIHLSDIGFNAYVTKKFKAVKKRGMFGYIKAGWKIFWNQRTMQLNIQTDTAHIRRHAIMVVIANATKYGTGILINPEGKLDDELFEVVIVKRISFYHSLKMLVTRKAYDPKRIEVFSTGSVQIRLHSKAHFQVDGEYLDKVNTVKAVILPGALQVIIPETNLSAEAFTINPKEQEVG